MVQVWNGECGVGNGGESQELESVVSRDSGGRGWKPHVLWGLVSFLSLRKGAGAGGRFNHGDTRHGG
jgi:hypothetical protein